MLKKEKRRWPKFGLLFKIDDYTFNFNSIFSRNFRLIFLILVLPLLLVLGLGYHYNNRNLYLQMDRENSAKIVEIKDSADTLIADAAASSLSLSTDLTVSYMAGRDLISGNSNMIENLTCVQNKINSALDALGNGAVDICVYLTQGQFFITKDSAGRILDQKDNFHDIPISMLLHGNSENYCSVMEKNSDIYFISKIVQGTNYRGIVVIVFDKSVFSNLLQSKVKASGSKAFLVDPNGKIIVGSADISGGRNIKSEIPNFQSLSTGLYTYTSTATDAKHRLISVFPSGKTNWKYVLASSQEIYDKQEQNEKSLLIFLVLICVPATFVVSWLITYMLYNPIRTILQVLQNPKSSICSTGRRRPDEVAYIVDNIRSDRLQNSRIRKELDDQKQLLRESQSLALQAQINPHFINNTLESINWKVLESFGGQNDISRMLCDLSRLLKISLDTENFLVDISEELEHAKLYIALQKRRFNNRLDVRWNIDDTVLSCKTVKLSLQPLIENALKYGMNPRDQLTVEISCFRKKENVVFTIRDNGLGMDFETLEQQRQKLATSALKSAEHLGLANVNQRIQSIFGTEYGVSISSARGKGTDVTVIIPKME